MTKSQIRHEMSKSQPDIKAIRKFRTKPYEIGGKDKNKKEESKQET